jgi:uncharacterized RDD family membrane protein YckC
MSEYPPPPPIPQAPVVPGGPSGPRASFGRRAVALILDGVLLWIVYAIVWAVTNQGLASAVYLVVALVYYSYFEGGPTGQTLGKRAMGIRVYDFSSAGGPIGFGRGAIRFLGRILSSLACGLGYLWMLWDREKQCWQDKIATTVVVPVSSYPVQQ